MANKLQDVRKTVGMTQTELSEKSGISRTALSRYEHGHMDMSLTNAGKIADALGCTVDELLKREEE